MRFWDSSAVVPLILDGPVRDPLLGILESDSVMVVSWSTPVEIAAAVARREREGALSLADASIVLERLRALERAWHQVVPGDALRGRAQRLLRVHPLKAAESLQLAAALAAAGEDPGSLSFVCLDQRLADAARREGLEVIAP